MDVVVTVPRDRWDLWLCEGDLPGEAWTGNAYNFSLGGPMPDIGEGERVYVVAHGRLRGFAPLVRVAKEGPAWTSAGYRLATRFSLVRHGGAVACTIPEPIRGFRGWRYRWWDLAEEEPFPNWRVP